jgi:large subunit ribosomal protein L20
MPRVKRGVSHLKRRKKILSHAKGYHWGRKKKLKLAKVAITKAGVYAFRDRRAKKRSFRGLWLTKLSAALRERDMSYSKFMGSLKKSNISLDRKILAELAEYHPAVFDAIIKEIK